jgi:hypothetical protein
MLTPKDIEKITQPLYEKSVKENKEYWRQQIKKQYKNQDNAHQKPEHAKTRPVLSHKGKSAIGQLVRH